MTTYDDCIAQLVASVDAYASSDARVGKYTPSAYRVVQELYQRAIGYPWCTDTPDELQDMVKDQLIKFYGFGPESFFWHMALQIMIRFMDNLAETANE